MIKGRTKDGRITLVINEDKNEIIKLTDKKATEIAKEGENNINNANNIKWNEVI